MEYYTLDTVGKIERETDKARLIKVTVGGEQVLCWFPKSQCRMKTNTKMEIPEWLLEEKEAELGGPIKGVE